MGVVQGRKKAVCVGQMVEALEGRRLMAAALMPDYVMYRASTGKVLLDTNGDHVADRKWIFGQAGDQITAGDFDGNTVSDLTIYRAGTWFVDLNTDGTVDRQIGYGGANFNGLLGDISGDGLSDMVLYDRSSGVWSVDVNRDGWTDAGTVAYFKFGGQAGDIPLVGDFDGNGKDDPIIYRNGTWLVDYNRDGTADVNFALSGVGVGSPVLVNVGGDYRVRAGVVVNGQWNIDADDNRAVDTQFSYGFAGDRPVSGFFNTANSIFVSVGATGNGTVTNPLGTLSAAVAAHTPGKIIRVAKGRYVENVVPYKKADMTMVGAGRNATKIAPLSGDAIAVLLGSNTWLHNMRFTGGGRGVISLGGDVHLRYISTRNVTFDGLVANDSGTPEVRPSKIDAVFCNFSYSQRGDGVHLQGNTVATIRKTNVNGNGTAPDLVAGAANGRGLILSGNTVATIRRSSINDSKETNLSVIENATVDITDSTMNDSKYGNGAMFLNTSHVLAQRCSFSSNGLVRDPARLQEGRNGIEFYQNFTGVNAKILDSTFLENTGFGIMVASGTGILVRGNTFDNNVVGIGVEGERVATQVTVQSNIFQVPVGSSQDTGVFIYGPYASMVLGGATADVKNTFRNYAWQYAITISPYSVAHVYMGYPDITLTASDNVFINCPDPIRYVE